MYMFPKAVRLKLDNYALGFVLFNWANRVSFIKLTKEDILRYAKIVADDMLGIVNGR